MHKIEILVKGDKEVAEKFLMAILGIYAFFQSAEIEVTGAAVLEEKETENGKKES